MKELAKSEPEAPSHLHLLPPIRESPGHDCKLADVSKLLPIVAFGAAEVHPGHSGTLQAAPYLTILQ